MSEAQVVAFDTKDLFSAALFLMSDVSEQMLKEFERDEGLKLRFEERVATLKSDKARVKYVCAILAEAVVKGLSEEESHG